MGKSGTPDWQEQKCCPSNMGRIVGKGRREAGRQGGWLKGKMQGAKGR